MEYTRGAPRLSRKDLSSTKSGSTNGNLRPVSSKISLIRERIRVQLQSQLDESRLRQTSNRSFDQGYSTLNSTRVADQSLYDVSGIRLDRTQLSNATMSRADKFRLAQTLLGNPVERRPAPRSPPNAYRRRLDRPGRPIVPVFSDDSDSPGVVRQIRRNLLPPRPRTSGSRTPDVSSFGIRSRLNATWAPREIAPLDCEAAVENYKNQPIMNHLSRSIRQVSFAGDSFVSSSPNNSSLIEDEIEILDKKRMHARKSADFSLESLKIPSSSISSFRPSEVLPVVDIPRPRSPPMTMLQRLNERRDMYERMASPSSPEMFAIFSPVGSRKSTDWLDNAGLVIDNVELVQFEDNQRDLSETNIQLAQMMAKLVDLEQHGLDDFTIPQTTSRHGMHNLTFPETTSRHGMHNLTLPETTSAQGLDDFTVPETTARHAHDLPQTHEGELMDEPPTPSTSRFVIAFSTVQPQSFATYVASDPSREDIEPHSLRVDDVLVDKPVLGAHPWAQVPTDLLSNTDETHVRLDEFVNEGHETHKDVVASHLLEAHEKLDEHTDVQLHSLVEVSSSRPSEEECATVVDKVLDEMFVAALAEICVVRIASVSRPASRRPVRVDAFDPEVAPLATGLDIERVLQLVGQGAEFAHLMPKSVSVCIQDAIAEIWQSLPPAQKADRQWASRCSGMRNPLAEFLPDHHTNDSVATQLKQIISGSLEARFCEEFVTQFKLDDSTRIFHQNNIIDEVNAFVFDAVIASVARDFVN